jgi:hypothetical protein
MAADPSSGNAVSQDETSAGNAGCSNCRAYSADDVTFVYALGQIAPRFRSLSTEKEFAQAAGRTNTAELTDRQTQHEVLTTPGNRYLLRQLCWVLAIEGLETYLLRLRDLSDLSLLIDAIRPNPRRTDVDVVIGVRGPIAPPELCGGLMLPMITVDQVYSFDIDALIKAIPKPPQGTAKQFEPVAQELFLRIMQMADNAGAMDEHRALNYLAVRYDAIYALAAQMHSEMKGLSSVSVRPSRLTGPRKVVDAVFEFVHRQTGVTDRFFVRVDVTEEFPFLVSKLSPYYVYDQYP